MKLNKFDVRSLYEFISVFNLIEEYEALYRSTRLTLKETAVEIIKDKASPFLRALYGIEL